MKNFCFVTIAALIFGFLSDSALAADECDDVALKIAVAVNSADLLQNGNPKLSRIDSQSSIEQCNGAHCVHYRVSVTDDKQWKTQNYYLVTVIEAGCFVLKVDFDDNQD